MHREAGRKAVRAAAWVVGGYGISQLLRLGGNLVLARILAPELFGTMAIAQVFVLGLGLLSDIGLEPAVIRSARAGDPAFLNTSWTLQAIRGVGLWVLSAAIAYPVSRFYSQPILLLAVPAIGFSSVLVGLKSTTLIILNRELRQGTLAAMELSVQAVSLGCTILLAYHLHSIWALVVGGIVSALVQLVWSHLLRGPVRNRLAFEHAAAHEVLSFGKWVLFSTAMTFLATQADRLLLGRLFPLAFFGVYNIAAMFATLPKEVVTRVAEKVVFPLFSQLAHSSREELRTATRRQRARLIFGLAVLVAVFASFADVLIVHLYDARYREAAWILPILAAGVWPLILYASMDRSLYVIGKPVYPAIGNLAKFLYVIAAVPLGYRLGGSPGAVVAVALNEVPMYAVVNYGLARERLSLLGQDGLATLTFLAALAACLAVRLATGMGLPVQVLFP